MKESVLGGVSLNGGVLLVSSLIPSKNQFILTRFSAVVLAGAAS